jgi:hypothetical protein
LQCEFETNVTLDGTAFWLSASLLNARSDHTSYGAFDQELPATYRCCVAVALSLVPRHFCGR